MMKNLLVPALFAAAILFGSIAKADLCVYENTFDTDGPVSAPFGHAGGGGASTTVVGGALEMKSKSTDGTYGFAFFDGGLIADPGWSAVTTFSFNVTSSIAGAQLRMRARDTAWATGADDVARYDWNTSATDLSGTFQYVVNNTTAVATAPVVGGTIAANSYAIYKDGALVITAANRTTADGSDVNYLTLWARGVTAANGGPTQSTFLLDNFKVTTVPEPSTMGLIGFGALGLFARRRR